MSRGRGRRGIQPRPLSSSCDTGPRADDGAEDEAALDFELTPTQQDIRANVSRLMQRFGDEYWLAVETVAVGDADVVARFYLDVTEKLRLKKERDGLAAELSEQSLKDDHLPGVLSRHGVLVSMGPLVARWSECRLARLD